MSSSPVYILFGSSLSGFVTYALLQPANSLTCAGGIAERSDILGNVETCVNVFGSDLLGVVGAVDQYVAAGLVGLVFLVAGVIRKARAPR